MKTRLAKICPLLPFALILALLLASCKKPPAPTSFADYKAATAQESAYPKYNTEYPWESVVTENAALRLYYKTAQEQGTKFITELYYVLESDDEKTVLGSFTVRDGFCGADGKPLSNPRGKYLKGLCMERTLNDPFFVHAVYETTDSGELYETEVFCMLAFDGRNRTLVNWSPWKAEETQ